MMNWFNYAKDELTFRKGWMKNKKNVELKNLPY